MGNVTAKDIVRSVGLSSEIEAHLTTPQDFDGDKLYDIFIQIQNRIGEDAADAFAEMIQIFYPLSTVNFLHSLYMLEKARWDFQLFHYQNQTYSKRNAFLRKLGEEKGPRELKKVNCKDNDFER